MKSHLVLSLFALFLWAIPSQAYELTASTFLGSVSETDSVRGVRIQSDGVIVVAANIGDTTPGGATSVLLNKATPTSGGVVMRISPDGRTVLSLARVADSVSDLALDDKDNILVAAGTAGVLKLKPKGVALAWARLVGKFIYRVDAGHDGAVVAHQPGNLSDPDSQASAGKTYVLKGRGTRVATFGGYHNTTDVCVDAASRTVVQIGWREANAFDGKNTQPVQIAFLRGLDYQGRLKWLNYDWSTQRDSPRFINLSTNNMADTRGYRCSIGRDGKLYAAFECAGGNHIFRWEPRDIAQKQPIVGGDNWHSFANTASEHKTFAGRYLPETGELLLAQQFTNRLSSGRGNTIRVHRGEICADENGKMYLGGAAASGLPIPFAPFYVEKPGQVAFNPFAPTDYTGGSWFIAMSEDLQKRLYTTRLSTGGETNAMDARVIDGVTHIAWGGLTPQPLHTVQPLQPASAGGQEGFLSVLRHP